MTRFALVAFLTASAVCAQPHTAPLTSTERTQWFKDAKFGLFIHWGAYSVIGRHEWARERFQIPQAEYDKYVRQFNPVKFDANAWVDLAQNAGARYMVITSKHHDGFSISRSKTSDYDMELTPYEGDPLKQLADAARRKEMRLGFYHSIMDWHHPAYTPKRKWEVGDPKSGGDLPKYLEFMKAQIKELLTDFGDVAVMWFDGEWEHTNDELKSDEIYDYIRSLQPNTLINDRLYNRKPGNKADFGTPEQFVPATGMVDPSGKPVLWESCVTINRDSWGYNKYETEFKTNRDLIRMLVDVVSKGGNLLLNVGPRPDGTIQEEFVTRLNAMGRWMAVNSEAIYETTASPFTRLPFYGRATVKNNVLYLHVFAWPRDGKLRVPGLKNIVHTAKLLGTPDAKLSTVRDGDDILVSLPADAPDEAASVIALQLDGKPVVTPYFIKPDADGVFSLGAESVELESGQHQRAKKDNALGHVFLTNWSRAEDVPVWQVDVPKKGRYKVTISYSANVPRNGSGTEFTLEAGDSKLTSKTESTGGDWVFKSKDLGVLALKAGEQPIRLKAAIQNNTPAMNLERIVLTPE